ncbi:hypothetical protein LR48_Vigan10g168700 [Vigna angularis]|uniref:Uncharacterized protein n=1 Tax=Phaseolus angularis TaxID=3914 RepID=A0A0L9VL61_PHAAN|nr:hypothetical protein LR48_Vigan10g168700 [Vigna angularis]
MVVSGASIGVGSRCVVVLGSPGLGFVLGTWLRATLEWSLWGVAVKAISVKSELGCGSCWLLDFAGAAGSLLHVTGSAVKAVGVKMLDVVAATFSTTVKCSTKLLDLFHLP